MRADLTAGGARVLVVDDSSTVRRYHRAALEQAGYAVTEAVNGYDALERVLAEAFAALVVDVNMPLMDGYTLVERVRREGPVPRPFVVVVSTESEPHDRAEAFRRGADGYLVKPVSPEGLVGLLRALAAGACAAGAGPR